MHCCGFLGCWVHFGCVWGGGRCSRRHPPSPPLPPRIDTSAAGGAGSAGGPPAPLTPQQQDLLQPHSGMDAARRPAAALLLLAGLAAAGEPATSRSDQAVGALLGLLLCLAVGLALAWRHLCRQSDGRYHPRPAGRRALAVLRGRWRQLRGRESAAEPDGEGDEAPEAEELMPWGAERQQRQEEEEEEEEEEQQQLKERGQGEQDSMTPKKIIGSQDSTPVPSPPVDVATFLAFPSPEKLLRLGPKCSVLIAQQTDTSDVEKVVTALLRISSVFKDEAHVKTAVHETADALMKKAFSSATFNSDAFITRLLIHMGLLKSEEKIKAVPSLYGILMTLNHMVQQDYFPKSLAPVLSAFVTKPNRALDSCSFARHMLLQTLHQL